MARSLPIAPQDILWSNFFQGELEPAVRPVGEGGEARDLQQQDARLHREVDQGGEPQVHAEPGRLQ